MAYINAVVIPCHCIKAALLFSYLFQATSRVVPWDIPYTPRSVRRLGTQWY